MNGRELRFITDFMERGLIMSADVYSADAYAEDSVREYNGAGFVIILGAIGFVFFTVFIVFLIFLSGDISNIYLSSSFIFSIIGWIYSIYLMVHNFLEKNATFNYKYNNGQLEIAKVRKNGSRKVVFSADCESMELMGTPNKKGLLNSKKYMKIRTKNNTNMSFSGEGLDNSKRDYCEAYFNFEGNYIKFIFNPSEEFIETIKRQYPSKVFYNEEK
jgi:hypothetical protein